MLKQRKQAFTIVELVVATGLVALVGITAMRMFSSVGIAQQNLSQQALLQMESRRAFDNLVDQIRMGTDIVRPTTGETLPYMVFKDVINQMTILYLEPNNTNANLIKKRVYRLVSYRGDYSGKYQEDNEKILLDSVSELHFTSLSPTSVQVNATVINEKGEYQFLAHIGLMNLGGIE
ncbi:MAG: hypothetical protein CVV42_10835 [Candidatus Riflebacteria bacterium HGW-Riflebacteria-2]|jgi:type II secretory pathway pseudopilin PulG|nr:MAG: hypothetical protein CVV42_10835 [Candidatus Riflebacteria bacterium HGW-Riflebacteria-2]